MTVSELEQRIALLRSRPLALLCRTPKGKEQVMTARECVDTGSVFVHVVADELDALLAAELGESKVYQKRSGIGDKFSTKLQQKSNVLSEKREKKLFIEDDNVYTMCPRCGKEMQIDLADAVIDGALDLYGTSWYCEKCSEKVRSKGSDPQSFKA